MRQGEIAKWLKGITIVILAVSGFLQPGILLIVLAMVMIHMIIVVLAAALSHLILKAYEMKQETELTI